MDFITEFSLGQEVMVGSCVGTIIEIKITMGGMLYVFRDIDSLEEIDVYGAEIRTEPKASRIRDKQTAKKERERRQQARKRKN